LLAHNITHPHPSDHSPAQGSAGTLRTQIPTKDIIRTKNADGTTRVIVPTTLGNFTGTLAQFQYAMENSIPLNQIMELQPNENLITETVEAPLREDSMQPEDKKKKKKKGIAGGKKKNKKKHREMAAAEAEAHAADDNNENGVGSRGEENDGHAVSSQSRAEILRKLEDLAEEFWSAQYAQLTELSLQLDRVTGTLDEEDSEVDAQLTKLGVQLGKVTETLHEKDSEVGAQLNELGVQLERVTGQLEEKDSHVEHDNKSQSDAGQIEDMLCIGTCS
jgi:hypothetical protein